MPWSNSNAPHARSDLGDAKGAFTPVGEHIVFGLLRQETGG